MEFKDLKNNSELEFTDISSEQYRIYNFPNGKSRRIDNPIALNVSDSGGHRIIDKDENCYYVYPDGRIIEWKVKEGEPHFVK